MKKFLIGVCLVCLPVLLQAETMQFVTIMTDTAASFNQVEVQQLSKPGTLFLWNVPEVQIEKNSAKLGGVVMQPGSTLKSDADGKFSLKGTTYYIQMLPKGKLVGKTLTQGDFEVSGTAPNFALLFINNLKMNNVNSTLEAHGGFQLNGATVSWPDSGGTKFFSIPYRGIVAEGAAEWATQSSVPTTSCDSSKPIPQLSAACINAIHPNWLENQSAKILRSSSPITTVSGKYLRDYVKKQYDNTGIPANNWWDVCQGAPANPALDEKCYKQCVQVTLEDGSTENRSCQQVFGQPKLIFCEGYSWVKREGSSGCPNNFSNKAVCDPAGAVQYSGSPTWACINNAEYKCVQVGAEKIESTVTHYVCPVYATCDCSEYKMSRVLGESQS